MKRFLLSALLAMACISYIVGFNKLSSKKALCEKRVIQFEEKIDYNYMPFFQFDEINDIIVIKNGNDLGVNNVGSVDMLFSNDSIRRFLVAIIQNRINAMEWGECKVLSVGNVDGVINLKVDIGNRFSGEYDFRGNSQRLVAGERWTLNLKKVVLAFLAPLALAAGAIYFLLSGLFSKKDV